MERASYPSDLTDAEWQLIEPLLPPFGESTLCETVPRREILNGILYVVRSGIQWRMMPHDLPNYKTLHYYHQKWSRDGTWERINDHLVALERERKGKKRQPTVAIGDSQSVKTTQKKGSAAMTVLRKLKGVNDISSPIRTEIS